MNQLDSLSLDRFLNRQNTDYGSSITTPFSGLQPGIQADNSYTEQGNTGLNSDEAATTIAPGTNILGCLIRSSNGGRKFNNSIFGGRVEMNQGFKDRFGNDFPYDSLTAFDSEGKAIAVISGAFGITALQNFTVISSSGFLVPQPKSMGAGRVLAAGTFDPGFTPLDSSAGPWSVTHVGTGVYQVTHNLGLATNSYGVLVTSSNVSPIFSNESGRSANFFQVSTYDIAGAPIDTDFNFNMFTN